MVACMKTLPLTSRRDFVKSALAGTTSLSLFPQICAAANRKRKPNVVILFIDDLGYEPTDCDHTNVTWIHDILLEQFNVIDMGAGQFLVDKAKVEEFLGYDEP